MSDIIGSLQSAGRSSSVLGAIANPQTVNPLAAYAGAAETAGRLYTVQDAQAQKAWGNALQQATDESGVTDYAKASAIAARDPLATMGMMKGLAGSTEIAGAVQGQGLNRNTALVNAYSSALAAPDDQLHDAVVANTQRLVASGVLTQDQAHRALLAMPNDPTQLRTRMEQARVSLLPPSMQQPALYGQPGSQTGPGGETIGTRQTVTGPNAGRVSPVQPPGTGVAGGLSAADLDSPFTYKDPKTGQEVTTTKRQWFIDNGFTFPASGGTGGGPGGLPSSLRNPAAQPPPGATTPPPAPGATTTPPPAPGPAPGPQPVPTAPAPGMEQKWKASADQYTADTAAAGQFQQRIFPLVQSRALLESGDTTTGQGAEAVQRIKGLLGTAAGQFGWNVNSINNAKFEELNKYLTQYTNGLPMAGASDARLASAITGNPSAHISTMANKDVVKALIGLERMKQTAISDFANQGGQPQQYADYLRDWQNKHDPRAFVFDMMDDAARKKMIDGMTPQQRTAFAATLDVVQRNPGIMGQAAMPQR